MEKKVAVIGGGISGMSFAHFCAIRGYKVTVFEKGNIGGCLQSVSFDGESYYELGGHTLTYTYTTVLDILNHYEKTGAIREKANLKFEAFTEKGFVSLLSRISIFSLLVSLPRLAFVKKDKLSLESYYGKVLGKKNYQNLFSFLFRAILCQNPNAFPASKLFKKRIKDKKFPKKYVLQKGVQQVLDVIRTNPNISCREQTDVTAIKMHEGNYQVCVDDKIIMEAPILAIACPANIAARLLGAGFPELSQNLQEIQQVQVETALVEVMDENIANVRKKSILGTGDTFFSAIRIPDIEKVHWCFYFPADTYSEMEKKKILHQVFQVDVEKIDLKVERKFQLPNFRVPNLDNVENIEKHIKGTQLFFATNYMDGLSIEDCCVRSKREAERLAGIL